MKPLALRGFLALVLVLLVLYACQDTPEITQPSSASAAVTYRLTLSGLGTGNGGVTSSPAGINCTITGGTAGGTGCSALFNQGVAVSLSAKPASGHSFVGWGGACSGTGTCRVVMSTTRTVSARFLKGPFTVRISSGPGALSAGRAEGRGIGRPW